MNTSLSLQSPCAIFDFNLIPIEKWTKEKIAWIKKTLDKHTDVISNVGILAITTCLLASKIFEKTPKILPRLAKVVFDYCGIIWLNVQIRDFFKNGKDFIRASKTFKFSPIMETAAKVFVKGANVLLTCVYFAGSVASAFFFPQASLTIALAVRSFALSCLVINIGSYIRDYFANKALLKRLEKLEKDPQRGLLIGKVMVCFLEIVKNTQTPSKVTSLWKKEWELADALVRQLEHYTMETFKESFDNKERKEKSPFIDALKLFYGVKQAMINKQSFTEGNLSLIAFNYVGMGICKAFPDSLIEMIVRWSSSVLSTDQFLQEKFFQSELSEQIS